MHDRHISLPDQPGYGGYFCGAFSLLPGASYRALT